MRFYIRMNIEKRILIFYMVIKNAIFEPASYIWFFE